jgi:hypothetical protein
MSPRREPWKRDAKLNSSRVSGDTGWETDGDGSQCGEWAMEWFLVIHVSPRRLRIDSDPFPTPYGSPRLTAWAHMFRRWRG